MTILFLPTRFRLRSHPRSRQGIRLAAAALLLCAAVPAWMLGQSSAQPTSVAVSAAPSAVPSASTGTASYGDLLQFQPASDQAYRLGRGDTVSINVEGRPELTGKQIVGPDGDVTLPMVGTLSVVDRTRDEAASLIAASLLKFYTHPVVTVGVDAYTSNRILLLGAVERPGVEIFDRPPTLLEVLVRGGSATRPAGTTGPGALTSYGGAASSPGGGYGGVGGFGNSGNSGGSGSGFSSGFSGSPPAGYGIGTSAGTLPDRCILYRGNQTAITLDLKGLIASGSSLANLRLQRDDVVYVPANSERYVSVLGQVFRPGTQLLQQGTTLARLLSDAGGPTLQAGRNPTIKVYEVATGRLREIDFKDLLKGKATEIPLHSGDIVYLPMSGFNSASYTVERLSPLVSIFTTAALLNQR